MARKPKQLYTATNERIFLASIYRDIADRMRNAEIHTCYFGGFDPVAASRAKEMRDAARMLRKWAREITKGN